MPAILDLAMPAGRATRETTWRPGMAHARQVERNLPRELPWRLYPSIFTADTHRTEEVKVYEDDPPQT